MSGIEGLNELQRELIAIRRKQPQIAARVLSAGLKEVAKELKSIIPDSLAGAKATVGQRVSKSDSDQRGKVGYGVGRGNRAMSRRSKVSGGIGISANNVHWFVLGTKNRRTKRGFNRGRMPPLLQGTLARAVASSQSAALEAMQKQLRIEIEALNK